MAGGYANIFKYMFSDSKIAAGFSQGRTKVAYQITYGLKEYFKEKLSLLFKNLKAYSILFDETYNDTVKLKQTDVYIMYFDEQLEKVVMRFLGCEFLGHACADDLLRVFHSVCESYKLKPELMVSLGMDGPNVNLKTYKLINDDDQYTLLDQGPCPLHQINNCSNSLFPESAELIRQAHKLLNKQPARQEDYFEITKSEKLPLQFCTTR